MAPRPLQRESLLKAEALEGLPLAEMTGREAHLRGTSLAPRSSTYSPFLLFHLDGLWVRFLLIIFSMG